MSPRKMIIIMGEYIMKFLIICKVKELELVCFPFHGGMVLFVDPGYYPTSTDPFTLIKCERLKPMGLAQGKEAVLYPSCPVDSIDSPLNYS